MRLLTFIQSKQYKLGVKTEQGILDVFRANERLNLPFVDSVDAFYKHGTSALEYLHQIVEGANASDYISETNIHYAPVVPNPGKVLCVGLNYRRHAQETGAQEPPRPLLFSKFNNAISAHQEDILLTPEMTQVDYEAELLVVMGATTRYVSEADALSYVLGYASANDVSERALQMSSSQWLIGKTLDKFQAIGPYVVTADEAGDPANMPVTGWLNGQMRQNSNTNDMIFSVAQVISFVSKHFTLEAGDIISTGTPEGVILGMKEKIWLKDGDVYEVEIGNLGKLTNKFVKA
jgi:2-keto-4-pentenoate hydratase/2-oxohepta-3-ene-1,7-dioic acid hydratase in catechol pathway